MKLSLVNSETIVKRIKELASSYLPEWMMDEENPDASAAIAHIFADFLEQEILYYNYYPERFRIEFVNMYGISQSSAYPAESVVCFGSSALSDTRVVVPAGTELIASPSGLSPETSDLGLETGDGGADSGLDDESFIFRTMHDIALTQVNIERILNVSQRHEKITVCKANMLPQGGAVLFGFEGENIYENVLAIQSGFKSALNGESFFIRFAGNRPSEELARIISDPREFTFFYSGEGGIKPFDKVLCEKDRIQLISSGHFLEDMIYIRPEKGIGADLEISRIEMIPMDAEGSPDAVLSDGEELSKLDFRPFGTALEEFKECYIFADSVFMRAGAHATLSFEYSLEQRTFINEAPQAPAALPVIKRKKRYLTIERLMTDCYVDEFSMEYYNGLGWRQIPTEEEVRGIFSEKSAIGQKQIKFDIPYDWEEITEGGFSGRAIRMRVRRADNCYLVPATHHYPRLKNLKLSFAYGGKWIQPERVTIRQNGHVKDITLSLAVSNPQQAFPEFPFKGNEVYFEMDGKFKEGPIGIFLGLADSVSFSGTGLSFSYSSLKGFRPLHVIDQTDSLTKSGVILFQPPSDWREQDVFGEKKYYLRISDTQGLFDSDRSFRPRLLSIKMNAAKVTNIEELDSVNYYLDSVQHNMSFDLNPGSILDADVWVNEFGELSDAEMKLLMERNPEKVRALYNIRGETSDFFVKWTEVEEFTGNQYDGRVYKLDRMNNKLIFGEGTRERIPKNTESTAFTVSLRISNGKQANLPSNSIARFRRSVLFVDTVEHPIAAYGGNPMESTARSCARAASIIGSRNRLITEEDFVNAALMFSENVNQAACIVKDERISIVLLMEDYLNGSFSFKVTQDRMRESFLDSMPLSVDRDYFEIREPVFVRINLDLWIKLDPGKKGQEFEIEKYWLKRITDFLNPINRPYSNGWRIGTLPTENQFRRLFHDTGKFSVIDHYQITAQYADELGIHTTGLEGLVNNPFVVPTNGQHTIHIDW